MKIVIKDATVEVQKGTSKKTGNAYEMKSQSGTVVFGPDHMQPVRIPLGDNQSPYAAGDYNVAAESFGVSNFGDLELRRLRLEPIGSATLRRAR